MRPPDHLRGKLLRILISKSEALLARHPDLPVVVPDTHTLNPVELFPAAKFRFLEIGAGWGEFALELAMRNPDAGLIAIEKKLKRVAQAARKTRNQGITNLIHVNLDVEWAFREFFPGASFDRVIINFPDPWPKARHRKHRFMHPEFLQDLIHLIRPGGILEFASDFYPYVAETLQVLEDSPAFRNVIAPGIMRTKIPDRPVSYFESLQRESGFHTYFLVYERTETLTQY